MKHETLLKKAPSLLSLYIRALLKNAKYSNEPKAISTLVLNTQADPSHLTQYKQLCQIASHSNTLPELFPQVLAFKLHLEFLLSKQLPFPVMGLVHRDNKVEYFSPIYDSDKLTIKVGLNEYKATSRGINCSLLTQVFVKDELKWQAISTYFYRSAKTSSSPKQPKHTNKKVIHPNNLTIWPLNANLGRQYAKITGDLNPIHLFKLTAKLFGFKQTIIHGMYMAARASSHALPEQWNFPLTIHIVFNKPVYLPSKVAFVQSGNDFNICPIFEQQVIDTPMLSGKLETNMELEDSNTSIPLTN